MKKAGGAWGLVCCVMFLAGSCQKSAPPLSPSPTPAPLVPLPDVNPQARPEPEAVDKSWLGMPEAIRAASLRIRAARGAAMPERWLCRSGKKPGKAKNEKLARASWQNPAIRQRVPHDEAYWVRIRGAYVRKGYCDVEAFLLEGITEVEFFGERFHVHPRVASRLIQVEQKLAGEERFFEWAGAFYPRTIRGPFKTSTKLSNHGLGLAVDFDPARNPYLSRRELKVIELVAGEKLKRAKTFGAQKRWDSFSRVNALWLQNIDVWTDRAKDEIRRLEKSRARRDRRRVRFLKGVLKDLRERPNLVRARKEGFVSLPLAFVVAMENAGFSWATWFKPGADVMHFELRRPF